MRQHRRNGENVYGGRGGLGGEVENELGGAKRYSSGGDAARGTFGPNASVLHPARTCCGTAAPAHFSMWKFGDVSAGAQWRHGSAGVALSERKCSIGVRVGELQWNTGVELDAEGRWCETKFSVS